MSERERLEDLGCGDGACVFRTPTGMHTNAGCRCLPRRATDYDLTERSRLRRWVGVMRDRIEEQERELAEARRRVATQDAHIESMLRFICEAHDYLRGKGNPDLPAWVLSAMAQEILDCVPEDKSHD